MTSASTASRAASTHEFDDFRTQPSSRSGSAKKGLRDACAWRATLQGLPDDACATRTPRTMS